MVSDVSGRKVYTAYGRNTNGKVVSGRFEVQPSEKGGYEVNELHNRSVASASQRSTR
jgi:hypothetical protein